MTIHTKPVSITDGKLTNTKKLAIGYRYNRECLLSPWNAQLVVDGNAAYGNPIYLGDGFVAVAPPMPIRRRVSIEEFEADMRLARVSKLRHRK